MVNAGQGTGQPRLPQAPLGSFPCSLWALCPLASAKLSTELGQGTGTKEPSCLVPSRFWGQSRCGGTWQQRFFLHLLPRPGGRLAGRAHLPCQTGTRCSLSSSGDPALAQMVYYPLAGTLCPAQQCLFLHPLTCWDHGQGDQVLGSRPPPPSHLPWPPCQPQRGGGLASSLSFLLWRARASPFPCQHRAGEFLPHFSQMLLPLAQASACISLSVVCWDPGSQRNWKSSQVDKSLRKGVSFNPKPTSMNLSG